MIYTNHSDSNLNRYFNDIRSFKPLTDSEEKALIRAAQNGDMKARDKVIESNLLFVVSLAKPYSDLLDLKDLIQAGNIGLMEAVELFDLSRDNCFRTYAKHFVVKYIVEELNLSNLVHIPDKEYRSMKSGEQEYMETVHMDDTLGDDTDCTYGDMMADEDCYSDQTTFSEEQKEFLESILSSLPEKKAKALRLYYGLEDGFEHPYEVIADQEGVSRERARQLCQEGLEKLRSSMRDNMAA